MLEWLFSLRVPICLLAGLQAIASFRLAGTPPSWLAVLAVFFIASATMLQNDWRDRRHDYWKGKTLATNNPQTFLAVLAACWGISAGLILIAAVGNENLGIALAAMAVVGLVYSETRRIPLAPVVLVSLTAASPSLLPAAAGANPGTVLPLFVPLFLIVFGREVTKDLDDARLDAGYKWTIPVVWGNQPAKVIAAVAIILGLAALLKVSLLTMPGSLIAMFGIALLIPGANPKICRVFLDVGMILTILTLLALGAAPQPTATID